MVGKVNPNGTCSGIESSYKNRAGPVRDHEDAPFSREPCFQYAFPFFVGGGFILFGLLSIGESR